MNSLDLEFLTVKSHEILKDALHNLVPSGVETAAHFPKKLMTANDAPEIAGRYTLKTTVKILLGNFNFDAAVIGFRQDDGTGDDKNYQIEGVLPKHTPRNKLGYSEIIIPLGTSLGYQFQHGITSLNAESFDSRGNSITYATFNTPALLYSKLGIQGLPDKPKLHQMDLTFLGENGNPHAIIARNMPSGDQQDTIQLAAFIPLEKEDAFNKILVDRVKILKTYR